jgi:NAD-dependent deacetylase
MASKMSFKEIIDNNNNIVFFGGAGVSTESGIPDFRSATGLYTTHDGDAYPPEYMLSHTCFIEHTKEFYRFYRQNIIYPNAKPNNAHIALAKLEKQGILKAVITQNIDGLHQMAGSKNVIELHGSVHRNYCTKCHAEYDFNFILNTQDEPRCIKCGNIVKPDVVLYEEPLNSNNMEMAMQYIKKADVLIVGGTSLNVYPAAGLIQYFHGQHLILINKSATPYDNIADLVINDDIGKTLGSLFN